jgi:glycosyltransferase involved in cell wall biosynthesis
MISVPKVSVVIPTRNRPSTLKNAVDSVLVQTLSDFEVIVVVDGEDGIQSSSLIASFGDGRLRCIVVPQAVGGSEARNIGVRHARARFVALLDDDDEWMPTKLEKQLKKAEEYPTGTPIVLLAPRMLSAREGCPGQMKKSQNSCLTICVTFRPLHSSVVRS